MSTLADDICNEIRTQFAAADHFKRLWMQANDELERVKTEKAVLEAQHIELKHRIEGLEK